MIPELRIHQIELVKAFKKEWEAVRQEWQKEPYSIPKNTTLWKEFMVGKGRHYEQGDFGILGKVGKGFPHVKVQAEEFNVDQLWFYTYDPQTGKVDDGRDRPWRGVVAIEHDSDPGSVGFKDNLIKLMHLNVPLKVSITYPAAEAPRAKYTNRFIKEMVVEYLVNALDTGQDQYLLWLGEGMWDKIVWEFWIFNSSERKFTTLPDC